MAIEYLGLSSVEGPLVVLEGIQDAFYDEIVEFVVDGNKKKIQDAHEAIRPTDITRTPISLKESLSRDQFRLYQLIWKRFTASQMQPAKYETTSVKIKGGEYYFTTSASKLKFDGFMAVYVQEEDEKSDKMVLTKGLDETSELTFEKFNEQQHFTQPPAHYTEATLVKTLEELGIGRPSTYAPTITTIIARRYVAKENKFLQKNKTFVQNYRILYKIV